jgi:tRNA (mo5U34)-methyltransferase
MQKRIDALTWYHHFDFGNGLVARSSVPSLGRLWGSMEQQLDKIDFRGKSVLDIGCWDGHWSFYAERRGAKSVLATDDQTQNWAGSQGFHLARELLKSKLEYNLNISVNDLGQLRRKFDIILFLGVYYHLFDPLFALAQIRHCCHPDTVVVIEGPVATALPAGAALFQFADHACEFLPTEEALRQLVRATYFTEVDRVALDHVEPNRPGRLGWRWRLRTCLAALLGSRSRLQQSVYALKFKGIRRRLFRFAPFAGTNELHLYRPPFGLHVYDDRFRETGLMANAPAA